MSLTASVTENAAVVEAETVRLVDVGGRATIGDARKTTKGREAAGAAIGTTTRDAAGVEGTAARVGSSRV